MKRKIFIQILFLMLCSSIVFATDQDVEELKSVFTSILGALSWVGYAIGIGALMFMGMKYVMSAAKEKAELKHKFVIYVAGVILIVAASAIVGAVAKVSGDNHDTEVIKSAIEHSGATEVQNSQNKKNNLWGGGN